MNRRDVLRAGAGLTAAGLAGCAGIFETKQRGQPPIVSDRPDAVYVPSHTEGMQMVGAQQAGDRMVGLFYSYAHRFWTITGTRTELVSPTQDTDVHLMASVWDPETKTVLPVGSGLKFTVAKDGERVDQRNPWAMLSQPMGFHFGDNVPLDGNGTYTVTVETGSMSLNRTGAFEGKFGDSATAEFTWDYAKSTRDDISYERLDDTKGQRGAVDPMKMKMPLSYAPPTGDLPGTALGTATSGDAVFAATSVERDGETTLVVSARTPHNRYVLPLLSLSASVGRDGSTAWEGQLRKALDPDLGYHYTATVESLQSGDEVTVTVDAPPQASRHEGYETAFVSMPDVTFTVP